MKLNELFSNVLIDLTTPRFRRSTNTETSNEIIDVASLVPMGAAPYSTSQVRVDAQRLQQL